MIVREGISLNDDQFVFDFKSDKNTDIIYLKFRTFNTKFSLKKGVETFVGYKYSKDADKKILEKFRNDLKSLNYNTIKESDLNLFINKAIIGLNRLYNISNLDIIISPESSSKLNDKIGNIIKEKAGDNTIFVSQGFIKNVINNIEIDIDKLSKGGKTSTEIQNIKNNIIKILSKQEKTHGSYKLHALPFGYRNILRNFIKFNSEKEKLLISKITNGNVLIIDDIYTRGTTVNAINDLVLQFNPNKLINFLLISSY